MSQEECVENLAGRLPRRSVELVDADAERSTFFAPGRAGVVRRAFCGLCFAGAVVVIGLCATLTPNPTGDGTHEQLYLAPCGFKQATGYPCPTCGMTTAFAAMARFQVLDALRYQPFGAALFIGLILAAAGWAFTALTGRRWPSWIGYILQTRWFLYGALALALGSWGYKILLTWLRERSG
jgi:hypothetical protein